jgi:hypothetical protein
MVMQNIICSAITTFHVILRQQRTSRFSTGECRMVPPVFQATALVPTEVQQQCKGSKYIIRFGGFSNAFQASAQEWKRIACGDATH